MTRVVNVQRNERYDVYIGRPSQWGNPYRLAREADRALVISKYLDWLRRHPALLARVGELKGKTLGCYCAPKACHGDVLRLLADGVAPDCVDLFI